MKNHQIQERKEPRMTLKEYMHSTSLRKRVKERASSREGSTERTKLQNNPHRVDCQEQSQESKRNRLVEELKVGLAQCIPKDSQLVPILKQLDQLIALFNQELKEQAKEKEVMMSMMTENKLPSKSPSLHSKQSQVAIEQNLSFSLPDELSFQELSASQHRRPQRPPSSKLEDDSLADIPNINFLLQTRHREQPKSTKNDSGSTATQLKKESIKEPQTNFPNDTFCLEDYHLNVRSRKPSVTSNASNFLNPHPHLEDQHSEVRISLRSSLWNNFEPRATRNKYDQPKR